MLNAIPPTGPRPAASGSRGGPNPRRTGGPSRGGITKRSGPRAVKVDKDGDLDMDAPTRPVTRQNRGPVAPSHIPGSSRGGAGSSKLTRASGSGAMRGGPARQHTRGPGLVEITVLGWQESRGNRDSVIDFLERKSVPFLQVGEITKWDNCQFAGSKLSIIAQNAPKIASKMDEDVIMAANPRPSEKSETIKILEQVLAQRYNPVTKMLDLSRLGEDLTLRQTGFFDLASTTSKMFPALMLVADRKFESAADKREAVVSVSLAYNNLKDIRVVSSLAATFPELKNLSLEGNLIPSWKDLDNWRHKFRKLEQLILSGNPIVATEGYKDEAMRRYPMLQMLDGVMLDRPAIKIGVAQPSSVPSQNVAPIAMGADTNIQTTGKTELPLPTKSNCIMDESGVGNQFLSVFFTMFDKDQDNLLASFYDDASQFSLAANTLAPRVHQPGVVIPPKPWEPYYAASRNLTRVYGTQLVNKLYIGPQKIKEAWNSLPKTRHDVTDSKLWVFDIWPIQGLPDISNPNNHEGVGGLIVIVHGEFEEVPEKGGVPLKRSFDRTFTLAPGGGPMNVRVVNDMMVVRAWGGSEAWSPDPVMSAFGEEAIKEQKVAEIRRRTRLNVQYATLCLQENGWNFDSALAAFERAKIGGLLPADAFA
ncbi:hypothetical protein BDZ91DRAFT_792309 [Kalaharituber pfeilii]|nr:hypothetical protein BDZ91DRAFT_792309 [Kalaharituber pfeilii]